MNRNAKYIIDRNKLIPLAEEFANGRNGKTHVGSGKDHVQWGIAWNYDFHQKMNELWRKNGKENLHPV